MLRQDDVKPVAQKMNIKDVEMFTDEEFFEHLEERKKAPASLLNPGELQQLTYELFRRIALHEKFCVDEMNKVLSDLNRAEVPSGYSKLLEMAVKCMYEAESVDELNIYYDYLASEHSETVEGVAVKRGGIREVFSAAGIEIPGQFWQILKDLRDTRLIHLETEKKHWQGVNIELGKLVIGATQILPLSDVAYAMYAWGSWGGMKGFDDFKTSFAPKEEPSAIAQFWQQHKKKIIIGGVSAVLVGLAIAAPFVIPLIPAVAGLSVATVALIKTIAMGIFGGGSALLAGGFAIKLGLDERKRANRVADRLTQFEQLVDRNTPGMKTFIKNKVERSMELSSSNSHAKVNKTLKAEKKREVKNILKEVNSIMRECRKIERKRRPKSERNLELIQQLTDFRNAIRKEGASYFSEHCEEIKNCLRRITSSSTEEALKISENMARLGQLQIRWLDLVSPSQSALPVDVEEKKSSPARQAVPVVADSGMSLNPTSVSRSESKRHL